MKLKSFHKEIRRTITHTLSRFLAIAAIVALGAGFLSGLIASSPVMRLRADAYYDHTGMMDIRILSTLGLTKEDLSVLTQIEGVQTAEGAHFLDIEGTIGEDSYLIRVHSLPGQINQLVLEEGRLPKAGECVDRKSVV